jgi:hypothetical protein
MNVVMAESAACLVDERRLVDHAFAAADVAVLPNLRRWRVLARSIAIAAK